MLARKIIHFPQGLTATLLGLHYLLLLFFSNSTPVAVNSLREILMFLFTFRTKNSHASEVVATLFLKT